MACDSAYTPHITAARSYVRQVALETEGNQRQRSENVHCGDADRVARDVRTFVCPDVFVCLAVFCRVVKDYAKSKYNSTYACSKVTQQTKAVRVSMCTNTNELCKRAIAAPTRDTE